MEPLPAGCSPSFASDHVSVTFTAVSSAFAALDGLAFSSASSPQTGTAMALYALVDSVVLPINRNPVLLLIDAHAL